MHIVTVLHCIPSVTVNARGLSALGQEKVPGAPLGESEEGCCGQTQSDSPGGKTLCGPRAADTAAELRTAERAGLALTLLAPRAECALESWDAGSAAAIPPGPGLVDPVTWPCVSDLPANSAAAVIPP